MSAFALRLAILPSILLLLFVVGKNKQRRNPTSLLVWLAVLGAVSAIPAVIVEIHNKQRPYMILFFTNTQRADIPQMEKPALCHTIELLCIHVLYIL
jgi:RsiW-degrading membrane proteinase PrsW (M82 family)